jgi:hypothetical protein
MNPSDSDRQYEAAAQVALEWLASQPSTRIDRERAVVVQLRDHLYRAWYSVASRPRLSATNDVPFVQQLRVAHAGNRTWSGGWIATHVSTRGRIMASRSGVQRLLSQGDYVNTIRPGMLPVPGASLLAIDRLESTEVMPGYWVTYSSDWFPPTSTVYRVYWNVEPDGAPVLIRQLTTLLRPHAYCLKVPSDPRHFDRTDAAVLYLRSDVTSAVWPLIRRSHDVVSPALGDDVPPLTCRLDTGLAFAEHDAASAESFGQHRCRLIAEALEGRTDRGVAAAREAIYERFAQEGLDPNRPWMRASHADRSHR